MKRKLYRAIASSFQAKETCYKRFLKDGDSNANTWHERHTESINEYCKHFMPSGSGFDCGTTFDFDKSIVGKRLVFNSSYHHMNENGYYDGWSELTVTIKPSFDGFDISITGLRRKNSCDSEYMYDTFIQALNQEVEK